MVKKNIRNKNEHILSSLDSKIRSHFLFFVLISDLISFTKIKRDHIDIFGYRQLLFISSFQLDQLILYEAPKRVCFVVVIFHIEFQLNGCPIFICNAFSLRSHSLFVRLCYFLSLHSVFCYEPTNLYQSSTVVSCAIFSSLILFWL